MNFPNPVAWANDVGNALMNSIANNISQFFSDSLEIIIAVSDDVCIIVGIIAFIFYIFGYKKGGNLPLLAWITSIIIKIIGAVMLGV